MSTSLFGPTHICGLYYLVRSDEWNTKKHFVPQVKLEAKATILATTSKTVLTQTFANPSTEKAIKECRYTFPLYDGVSVVRFTCHVGGRKIVGEVKEREKARAVFQDAVSKGETAGLFEQLPDASDVFTTTVGNIPPGAKVIITITYLGELKHDMEVDGIRFTIPNIICPRYGDYPGTLCRSSATDAMSRSISITVDVDMADGSFIQKIQSPTHPISVSMGTTSTAVNADPAMTKASATLALATAELDKDFVLQVIAKHTGVPKAILETNPRIPNHRAVMATLVPKFALPPARPEIVFVCDRSGSMQLTRIELAKQALKVFLKSLPVGVKFNICSFGSSYSFLWEKSASYNQQTLEEAMNHVGSFAANYGGTEMLQPLQATIERRYKDMDLDIMLLTDGEDWGQDRIFSYLNEAIQATKAPIRVFTLGVGNGVSHALIEGIAKAGNGFSQSVGENEPMNTKVVRMLKGALSPHINDYTLEVKYNNDEISAHLDVEPEDDFEIVEKVSDSLKIKLDLKEDDKAESKSTNKTPISLFDLNADPDAEEPLSDDSTGQSRYAHLPTLPVPNIIQAPQTIPSLYPFHRTSLYLLLGPSAPQGTPISLTLRGTSPQGPLELTIPIQPLAQPGEAIHQLAAKKAIAELEQGRGWLAEATDASGALVKKTCEGRYDDMVEREAVRLGVQFQVGGKWCSFVAVESNKEEAEKQRRQAEGWQWMDDKVDTVPQGQGQKQQSLFRGMPSAPSLQGNPIFFGGGGPIYQGMSLPALGQSGPPMGAISFGSNTSSVTAFRGSNSMGGGGLFGSANALGGAGFQASSSFGAPSSTGGGLFGGSPFGAPPKAPQIGSSLFSAPGLNHSGPVGAVPPPPPPGHSSIFGARSPSSSGSALFGAPAPAPAQSQPNSGTSLFGAPAPPATGSTSLRDYQSSLMLLEQQNKKRLVMARQENGSGTAGATSDPQLPSSLSGESLLHHLISLQSFEGSWSLTPGLLGVLGLDEAGVRAKMEGEGADEKVVATAIVIALFEERLEGLRGSWELVGEKGRAWLEGEVGGDEVEGWVERGKKVLRDD